MDPPGTVAWMLWMLGRLDAPGPIPRTKTRRAGDEPQLKHALDKHDGYSLPIDASRSFLPWPADEVSNLSY